MAAVLAIVVGMLMTAVAVAIGGLMLELILVAIGRGLSTAQAEPTAEQGARPVVVHLKDYNNATGALELAEEAA